ncbi:helix-turn-helix domain-containing protein [Alicyclobacillus sendaiensis]|uniref:helix-turn-helix domain-containing protein n=1 Tax=Alicyclobacillus sendaiensis TaxID=192387 RepID=UPI00350E4FD1
MLMAQRRIRTLAEIWRRTGISRTTLTTLYYGKGEGVRFATLDALCGLLQCDVGDLLKWVPEEVREHPRRQA